MFNTKHYITNAATGAALSTIVPTSTVNERIIVTSTFVAGALLGQLLGPDLDLPNSKPTRNGGYEILLIISFLLAIFNFGVADNTLLVLGEFSAIIMLMIKRFKPSFKLQTPDLIIGSIGLSYIIINYNYNTITSSSFYFFVFSLILIYTKKHRGISHSLIMIVLAGLSGYFTSALIDSDTIGLLFNSLVIGYLGGYITHIAMDFLGSKPIYFFAPLDIKVKPLYLYKTTTPEGKRKETIIVIIYCTISAIIFINFL